MLELHALHLQTTDVQARLVSRLLPTDTQLMVSHCDTACVRPLLQPEALMQSSQANYVIDSVKIWHHDDVVP